jgi:F-type H+-transporting ATPase subunit delta
VIGSRVTRRYAKALFELAQDKNILDAVENDLKMIMAAYQKSSELPLLLESPIIPTREKRVTFDKLFKQHVQQVTYDFLMLLLDKNREENLPEIIDHYMKSLDEYRGIVRGKLLTAHPFSESQKKALSAKLSEQTGKKILIEEEIDQSLIGGFVVRLEDTVIDTSLKNQLDKLRQNLIKK